MPKIALKDGYIAGWQSIRGVEPLPDIPPYQVPVGQTPYLAGVALGVRDACSSISAQRTGGTSIDEWLDGALRRGWTESPSAPLNASAEPNGARERRQ
jgi:hypothetical protein